MWRLVPDKGLTVICQEGPAIFDKKGTAVAHTDVMDNFCVIQDAAKIEIHCLEVEVWKMHFSPEIDIVHMRMLQVTQNENLFWYSTTKVISIGGVKPDWKVMYPSNVHL